jgi:ubiquinone/menaquinone biosynthesis C-methylase UbiE
MKNTIQANLDMWNERHTWTKDGDEWDGQASYHKQSYDEWKRSVIDVFLLPHLSDQTTAVEIAPGHGRWTETLVERCGQLSLVDLSPSCIDYCRDRFAAHEQITYVVNDGSSLPGLPDAGVDFVWSFDSFVHMDAGVIDAYLAEIHRVLRPGGLAILHHAGRRHATLGLGFLRDWGKIGRRLYKLISLRIWNDDDGWRSEVSKQVVQDLADKNQLAVESQVQSWGANGEFGVLRYGDYVTTLRKRG